MAHSKGKLIRQRAQAIDKSYGLGGSAGSQANNGSWPEPAAQACRGRMTATDPKRTSRSPSKIGSELTVYGYHISMQIYNWWGIGMSPEYCGASEEAERAITWYDNLLGDPLPPLKGWNPPTLTQSLGPDGKRMPRAVTDCVSSADLNFISERAANAMSEIWDRHATLYPVRLDDSVSPYFMVVVTTELDCLDREHSTGPLQKYGPTPDLFASVHTWRFLEDRIGNADLFVIPDSSTNLFVSSRFKSRIMEEGLTGFTLRTHFWEEDPWES